MPNKPGTVRAFLNLQSGSFLDVDDGAGLPCCESACRYIACCIEHLAGADPSRRGKTHAQRRVERFGPMQEFAQKRASIGT
jgi:hypothetical protein